METKGWAASSSSAPLAPYAFARREPSAHDIAIDISYCGICHSDLHQVRNEWSNTIYPIVPGHEIIGKVSRIGSGVTGFAIGDTAAVGCFVDSCRTCPACAVGNEQYCEGGLVFTYNGSDRDGSVTRGGYSTRIVVDQRYVLKVPEKLPLDRAAPLLCAGITTYSPLREWSLQRGQRLGVVGLGGLGHMAVKLGAAMGAEVTLFTSSSSKRTDALRLGAHDVAVTGEKQAFDLRRGRFDLILDTVSATHDLVPYLECLRTDGTMVLLGAPPTPPSLPAFPLIMRRRRLVGSLIGGIAQTQEMLDFCAANNVVADVEVIAAKQIDEAYERMLRSDVRYRFVLDTSTI